MGFPTLFLIVPAHEDVGRSPMRSASLLVEGIHTTIDIPRFEYLQYSNRGGVLATYYEDKTMKYLATTFAIAFMAIGFAATSAHAREGYDYSGDGHDCYNSEYGTDCISTSKIDNVEPLTETAQGGDRDGDVGGGDFGGENDRAAASTAAE